MIGFDELEADMKVAVTNGAPEPGVASALDQRRWNAWASHNFTGTVVALREDEADIQTANGTTWTVRRGDDHTFVPTAPSAELLTRKLHEQIDREANAMRPDGRQQAVYQIKEAEARAGGGPYLAAEAEARGCSVAELAALVIAAADEWRALDVRIEALRIAAKQAVKAARGREAKRADAQVKWPAATSAQRRMEE